MKAWKKMWIVVALAGGALALSACDDGGDGGGDEDAGGGGGEEDAGQAPPALRDVTLAISGADPHMGQLVEIRVVNEWDHLVAIAILDGLPSGDYTVALPNSTPEGAHRLDFFADLSGDRAYQAPPEDHAWREDLAETGDAQIDFVHNTDFTDIADPAVSDAGDLTFNASGVGPHVGQLFELRVIRTDTGQLVGRYVLDAIAEESFTITLPGIIEDGVEYQVDYFADLSDDNAYQAPPADHAWRDVVTGNGSGATVDFVHNTDFTDVGF